MCVCVYDWYTYIYIYDFLWNKVELNMLTLFMTSMGIIHNSVSMSGFKDRKIDNIRKNQLSYLKN